MTRSRTAMTRSRTAMTMGQIAMTRSRTAVFVADSFSGYLGDDESDDIATQQAPACCAGMSSILNSKFFRTSKRRMKKMAKRFLARIGVSTGPRLPPITDSRWHRQRQRDRRHRRIQRLQRLRRRGQRK